MRSSDQGIRVGYVLKKYPRLSETFILNEILGLESFGVDVSVFSLRLPDEGRFHAELAAVKADVRYVPAPGSAATLAAFESLAAAGSSVGARLTRALAFTAKLPAARRTSILVQGLDIARDVREQGIDHLHAHFMTVAAHTAYVAHLMTDVSFSVTAHAKDIYRTGVDAGVFSEVAGAAERIVTVCDANRQFIERELLVTEGARVDVIYNGIPIEEFSSVPERDRVPGEILAVGRLVEKKGFDLLVRACGKLRDVDVPFGCRIIGDGDQREKLEALVDELDLGAQVTIDGAQPRERVLGAMRRASVLAAPFVIGEDGNRDALPTVVLEAQALGLPVVASPVGGVAEMVRDGREGVIVEAGSVGSLTDGLRKVLGARTEEWSALSAAGPPNVSERFDRGRTIPQLIDVFRGREALVRTFEEAGR